MKIQIIEKAFEFNGILNEYELTFKKKRRNENIENRIL
jgi:hypothetical protein